MTTIKVNKEIYCSLASDKDRLRYMDLLLMCDHLPYTRCAKGGKTFVVETGEIVSSKRLLAKSWRCSLRDATDFCQRLVELGELQINSINHNVMKYTLVRQNTYNLLSGNTNSSVCGKATKSVTTPTPKSSVTNCESEGISVTKNDTISVTKNENGNTKNEKVGKATPNSLKISGNTNSSVCGKATKSVTTPTPKSSVTNCESEGISVTKNDTISVTKNENGKAKNDKVGNTTHLFNNLNIYNNNINNNTTTQCAYAQEKKLNFRDFMELYNSLSVKAGKSYIIRASTPTREQLFGVIAEKFSKDEITEAINNALALSNYIDVDWLLQEENFIRILEKTYQTRNELKTQRNEAVQNKRRGVEPLHPKNGGYRFK